MKGFYALDFSEYEQAKEKAKYTPGSRYFEYGFDKVTFGVQTQDISKAKVVALSMDMNRGAGYSIANTKGNIGEGFLSFEKLDNLKKHFLQG